MPDAEALRHLLHNGQELIGNRRRQKVCFHNGRGFRSGHSRFEPAPAQFRAAKPLIKN